MLFKVIKGIFVFLFVISTISTHVQLVKATTENEDPSTSLLINFTYSPLAIKEKINAEFEAFLPEAEKLIKTWAPKISSYLQSPNYTIPSLIYVEFNNCSSSVASHNFGEYGKIWACFEYFSNESRPIKEKFSTLITVLIFIIQNYNTVPRPPTYITYGIENYVNTYVYHMKETQHTRQKGMSKKWKPYLSSAELGYFFNYLKVEENSGKFNFVRSSKEEENMDLVQIINWEAREGRFNQTWFEGRTGKSIDKLWQDMIKDLNAEEVEVLC